MPTDAFIRIAALCVVLAGAETLHGIVRTAVNQAGAHQHGVNISPEVLLPGRRPATDK